MTFRTGQHVLCIIGNFGLMMPDEIAPTKGTVYTVRDTETFPEGQFIRLVEIVNPIHSYRDGPSECWFAGWCFRPLVSSRLDVFRKLLAPLKPSLAPLAASILALCLVVPALAHKAPSGWEYDRWCCSGKDCAEIPSEAVSLDDSGYVIRLLPGQHPLVTRPTVLHVPYGALSIRNSPDGAYHLCLYPDPETVRCFYKGPEGY